MNFNANGTTGTGLGLVRPVAIGGRAALLTVALIAMGGIFALTAATVANSADDAAIRAVVTDAIVTQQAAVVVPNSDAGSMLSDSQLSGGAASVEGHLRKIYTGAEFNHYRDLLKRAVQDQRDPRFRALAGGADWVKFSAVAVDGNTATVDVTFRTWSRFQLDSGQGIQVHEPHNTQLGRFTLVKANGQWLITDESRKWEPGSEP